MTRTQRSSGWSGSLGFLPLALLTVLTVVAALSGMRTAPPGLSPEVVAVAERFGYQVQPLGDETARHLDDAWQLFEDHGPRGYSSDREVLGIGLARVLDPNDPRPEQRIDGIYWVVVVDGALSHCFGGSCSEPSWSPERLTFEVSIVDPVTLESEQMSQG